MANDIPESSDAAVQTNAQGRSAFAEEFVKLMEAKVPTAASGLPADLAPYIEVAQKLALGRVPADPVYQAACADQWGRLLDELKDGLDRPGKGQDTRQCRSRFHDTLVNYDLNRSAIEGLKVPENLRTLIELKAALKETVAASDSAAKSAKLERAADIVLEGFRGVKALDAVSINRLIFMTLQDPELAGKFQMSVTRDLKFGDKVNFAHFSRDLSEKGGSTNVYHIKHFKGK